MWIKWQTQKEENDDRAEKDIEGASRSWREWTRRRAVRDRNTETTIEVDCSRDEDWCEENQKRFDAVEPKKEAC
jgi:hypothetical protein